MEYPQEQRNDQSHVLCFLCGGCIVWLKLSLDNSETINNQSLVSLYLILSIAHRMLSCQM